MVQWKRTHSCGQVDRSLVDQEITLNGWVNRRRDHGGVIFVDLRDRDGLVQIVFNPDLLAQELFALAERLRSEFVLSVTGKVVMRPEGQENKAMKTGEVEVLITDFKVLSEAKTPPFPIDRDVDVDENIRLKYRYLDLRRNDLQECIKLRHKAVSIIRDFLNENGFYEIETPMLTKSTPEGARDYIVPSRVHPGNFYALPQSPQMFKQLLMLAGFERYYQIARCFRDEDLRADRQPEFTQVDIEMSFVDREDIIEIMEKMIIEVFEQCRGVKIPTPIPRMSYQEAMDRFGSDRPDTRFEMELKDVGENLKDSGFKVFSETIKNGGVVRGINAKGCGATFARREIDQLVEMASSWGAKGLIWMVIGETVKSPVAKFLTENEISSIVEALGGEEGDLLLLVADSFEVTSVVLGRLRLFLGNKLGLIDENKLNFLWVVDWPLLEYDEEEKRYVAVHHPFTAPLDSDVDILETEPGKVRAKAYDLVLNGTELGGGSVRISHSELQERMFKVLGFSSEQIQEQFGFLIEAYRYGAPPHAGIAFGLDRIIMLLAGRSTIRDVIAFPKTASATDLMVEAPGNVSPRQLQELNLIIKS